MPDTPSQVFPKRLSAVRRRSGLTQQALSDRMDEVGLAMDRSTIGKIEAGARGVSIDEALALAVALKVAPHMLLLPKSGDEEVSIAPAVTMPTWEAHLWMRGFAPASRGPNPEEYRVLLEEGPDFEVAAMRNRPGLFEMHSRWALATLMLASDERLLPELVAALEEIVDEAEIELRRARRDLAKTGQEQRPAWPTRENMHREKFEPEKGED